MPDEPSYFDQSSREYAAHSDESPYNALYDRPAILDLAGDVRGRRVLDVGSAAGRLSTALADAGADVLGVDASEPMIAIARERAGDRVEFRVADIGAPLDFIATGSVDLVTASLVMHYLEDWVPTLREFRRALRPEGAIVLSTHHPGEDWRWFDRPDYFATERIVDRFPSPGGGTDEVTFFRRPLSAVFAAIREADLRVDELVEPMPVPSCRESHPKAWRSLTTSPRFLYLRLLRR